MLCLPVLNVATGESLRHLFATVVKPNASIPYYLLKVYTALRVNAFGRSPTFLCKSWLRAVTCSICLREKKDRYRELHSQLISAEGVTRREQQQLQAKTQARRARESRYDKRPVGDASDSSKRYRRQIQVRQSRTTLKVFTGQLTDPMDENESLEDLESP